MHVRPLGLQAALSTHPLQRSSEHAAQLVPLVAGCQLFAGLCAAALACVAQGAELLVLDGTHELPADA
jgi:hypothetical protein